jgi:hypothetical protein
VHNHHTLLDYATFSFLSTGARQMSNKLQEMTQDMQARISELAYMMWDSAGRQQGMAMDYWLKAEQEILTTLQAAATHMMPNPSKAQPRPGAAAKPVAVEAPKAATESNPAAVEAPKPVSAAEPAPAARKTIARGKSKA